MPPACLPRAAAAEVVAAVGPLLAAAAARLERAAELLLQHALLGHPAPASTHRTNSRHHREDDK